MRCFLVGDFSLFFEFFGHHAALERGKVVNEKFAVQVVDFVLQADCMHSIQRFFKKAAIAVLGRNADFFRPGDLCINTRDGEATFLASLVTL